ncbi:MAG TPA: hypothetical protein VLL49_04385, partial [Anaerolineales bacterium]|nr:hypothetical protein [Anaerolineales bacterium]
LRSAAWSLLIGLSVLTHQGLSSSALDEERAIAAFWQQMAWRATGIAPGTTLLVRYPGIDYGSDSDVVWGPANLIYHPEPQAGLPVRVPVSALTWERQTLNAVLAGRGAREDTYRSHSMSIDYSQVLIAVQSAPDACVRVLDPRWQMFSVNDDPALRALASASRVDALESDGPPVRPPASLFGPEPQRRWCYYFQQAAAAAQGGDWRGVAALQDELGALGLHPNDQIEWMPFLQAQAALGDLQAVKEIASRLNSERLYRQQACQNLRGMGGQGYALPDAMQTEVDELFCGGAQ